MQTGSPKVSRIVTMVLFALSCVGLLLFLWLSFGGTMPFNPQGYRFEVSFQNAFDLADQADVRIAGVSVGKVVGKQLDTKASGTLVTIQLNNKYAPIHRNATAILREKTLLGETYVQLTPGSHNSPPLADGGTLPTSQVVPAVQLDEIFKTERQRRVGAKLRPFCTREDAIGRDAFHRKLACTLVHPETLFSGAPRPAPSSVAARRLLGKAGLRPAALELVEHILHQNAARAKQDEEVIEKIGALADQGSLVVLDRGDHRLDRLLAELLRHARRALGEEPRGP